jgi:hypothetical protein
VKIKDKAAYTHPSAEILALYLRGDLPLFARVRLRRHVSQCLECDTQLALFASAHAELKRESSDQTLTAFEAIADWKRLEREMLGNIGVGLAAARCIEKVGRKHVWLGRVSVAVAAFALLILGWIAHIPSQDTGRVETVIRRILGLDRPMIAGTVVQGTPEGISVKTQQATLTILHPASAVVSVSGDSAMAARYVDEDTGQVTITNVYGQ